MIGDDSFSMQSLVLLKLDALPQLTAQKSFPKSLRRIASTTIHPRTYNEVEEWGRSLRDGTPVVLNLTGVADKDAQRIRFRYGSCFRCAGLCGASIYESMAF